MANPVKWFSSDMQGAPSLGDTTEGALTALLKAVLVTGFGQLTITGLSWDATEGAAVATVQSGHKHLQDSVALIEGVSPAAYNGEHRVKKVDTTRVWFELDGGNPGAAGSGAAMTIKVAPLGWSLTHESADGKVAIYRPTDISASGNVSLRIDNTAWTNWNLNNQHVAKAQLVEDVVDINTFTLVGDYLLPCTGRFSDRRWDFVGDSQLFYFIPAFGSFGRQHTYMFGYIKSLRPGDRYHAVTHVYAVNTPSSNTQMQWNYTGNTLYGNTFPNFDDTTQRALARPFHQLFGGTSFWLKGLFARIGNGVAIPNGPDNGFYMSTDPIMVMETNGHLRGYLPGLIVPFGSVSAWNRKNFANLPSLPNKIVRFVFATYSIDEYTYSPTMLGFDLTGPWR